MEIFNLSKSPLKEVSVIVDFHNKKNVTEVGLLDFIRKTCLDAVAVEAVQHKSISINQDTREVKEVGPEFAGYMFVLPKQNAQVAFLGKRFIYTKRVPYSRWEDIVAVMPDLLNNYEPYLIDSFIKRISVRSINIIDVEKGGGDFSEVLTGMPETSEDLGEGVCVNMRYCDTQYYPKYKGYVTCDRQYARSGGERMNPVRLDIDAFKNFTLDEKMKCVSGEILSDLRCLKDAAFKNAVAEQCFKEFV